MVHEPGWVWDSRTRYEPFFSARLRRYSAALREIYSNIVRCWRFRHQFRRHVLIHGTSRTARLSLQEQPKSIQSSLSSSLKVTVLATNWQIMLVVGLARRNSAGHRAGPNRLPFIHNFEDLQALVLLYSQLLFRMAIIIVQSNNNAALLNGESSSVQ